MQLTPTDHRRIELIDIARGTALVAMAIYHFTWDLDFFGYIEPGTSVTGGWKIFARSIASSFLFLVGVGLYLAHGRAIRLRSFARRLAMIAIAAAAITAVTYFATPDAFIFFGILHNITLSSVLGLLLLRLPVAALLALAAAVIAAPHFVHAPFLDQPVFWWTGLSRNVPGSNDYIPIFPWFGAVLLGIAAAKAAARAGLFARMAGFAPASRVPLLGAAGRHSLAFYLLHQPVLFSSVWLFAQLMPPAAPDRGQFFLEACSSQCAVERKENFCRAYCACVMEAATTENRLGELYNPRRSEAIQSWLEDVAFRCSVENNG
ncbi:heparan-alpha-glucosaminide N-acetyltransferase [Chelativorans xinjiangense]|uniref:heparan-alpha-glucosaminide N-acetyltransferase n=1 Tax=Chelativorans xinjiangense TaxID=2681485 RepID=UPI001FEA3426|nr:heparan-alpha-glucosaminide N-acetyltransferase domain-containing protein [Chelativorans xinjiangense]